jgi:hypothetical protein
MFRSIAALILCLLTITAQAAPILYGANGNGAFTIDTTSGAMTYLTSTNTVALGYGDGRLYGANGNGAFTIDTTSGAMTYLTSTNTVALGYGDGRLYGANGNGAFTIDTTSGAMTYLTSTNTVSLTTSPVPIPSAVWLFGSALGLVGVMRRKISS